MVSELRRYLSCFDRQLFQIVYPSLRRLVLYVCPLAQTSRAASITPRPHPNLYPGGQSSPVTWERLAYGHWWLVFGNQEHDDLVCCWVALCISLLPSCLGDAGKWGIAGKRRRCWGEDLDRKGSDNHRACSRLFREILCLPRSRGGVGWKRVPTFYKIASSLSNFNYETNIQVYSHGNDSGSRCVFVVVSEKMGQWG